MNDEQRRAQDFIASSQRREEKRKKEDQAEVVELKAEIGRLQVRIGQQLGDMGILGGEKTDVENRLTMLLLSLRDVPELVKDMQPGQQVCSFTTGQMRAIHEAMQGTGLDARVLWLQCEVGRLSAEHTLGPVSGQDEERILKGLAQNKQELIALMKEAAE